MRLVDTGSKKNLSADIHILQPNDLQKIQEDEGFGFDWDTEIKNEVYKIFLLKDKETILGLVSVIDIPNEYRIHLNLLEVTKKQQGKKKKINHIAGCLIAFIIELAFKRGYFGFVSLEPKTEIIELYKKKYGFKQYGKYLGIDGIEAQQLVEKYIIENE